MQRPAPPIGSLIYDEDGTPMRVVGVASDGIATLVYEAGPDRGFYRLMGMEDLGVALCSPYPEGEYDVTIEVTGTKTIRVPHDKLSELCLDLTPPVPYGEYMIHKVRPVRMVLYTP